MKAGACAKEEVPKENSRGGPISRGACAKEDVSLLPAFVRGGRWDPAAMHRRLGRPHPGPCPDAFTRFCRQIFVSRAHNQIDPAYTGSLPQGSGFCGRRTICSKDYATACVFCAFHNKLETIGICLDKPLGVCNKQIKHCRKTNSVMNVKSRIS